MKSRRIFIKKIAIASSFSSLPLMTRAESKAKNKMIHQVFFWLKEGQDVNDFIQEAKLLGKCKTVKKLLLGTPAATEDRDVVDNSYQVACTFYFENLEGQNIYQTDPLHLAFIEKNSSKWTKVKVYDFNLH
jgi:hypothetical protein